MDQPLDLGTANAASPFAAASRWLVDRDLYLAAIHGVFL
jgi:hypothetical protein